MSFYRLIFYSAVVGGWAAFGGWSISELALLRRAHDFRLVLLVLTAGIVGAAVAGALNLLAGAATNGRWLQQLPRAFIGMAGGFIGGAVGGLFGELIFQLYAATITRALGWTVMGLAIGSVEGLYDRSRKKIRNGLIGGGIGGFLGGLLFDPVHTWIGSDMSSRATAFVILGLFIGLFIGLAQVILKEAWLTVVEGFRPGRQLILNLPETWLGTSEKAQLPFIAFGAKGVEPIHLRILRGDGGFILQDNNSRTGTQVNGMRVHARVTLHNGDMIQLGPNLVRFSERFRHADREALPAATPGTPRPAKPSEAIAAVPVAAPGPVPTGEARPARPTLGGIPVGKPAPSPVRPGRPPESPRSSPAPVRSGSPPVNPPPPSVTPAANACPICARPAKGVPGKRICENCGIRF